MLTRNKIIEDYKKYVPEGIRLVGFDCETYKITNNVCPEIVCMTFFSPLEGDKGYIFKQQEGLDHLIQLLCDPHTWIIAHNACFDSLCAAVLDPKLLALITNAYKEGRIHCTKLREALLLVGSASNQGEISRSISGEHSKVSGLSLAGCMISYFGKDITASKKGDSWRLRYNELEDVPLERWPVEAITYAISDAEYAVAVFLAQVIRNNSINTYLSRDLQSVCDIMADAQRQAYVEFCFHYMSSKTGVRIDPTRVEDAETALLKEHHAYIKSLKGFGFYEDAPKTPRGVKVRKGVVKAAFSRCYTILKIEEPSIYSNPDDPLSISTARDPRDNLLRTITKALEAKRIPRTREPLDEEQEQELELLSVVISSYAEAEALWKETNTFIRALKNAALNLDGRIRYTLNGFVSTGRSSSKNPNMQNLKRDGAVRRCVIPNEDHLFIISDYSNAEMRTLAQVNYDEQKGYSLLAKEYRKDKKFDPHLFAAFKMYNIEKRAQMTFEGAKAIYKDRGHPLYKEMKKYRTLAKILNFGLAGGLSHVGFVSYARGYKVYLTLKESQKLCEMWLQVWAEMTQYFNSRSEIQKQNTRGEYIYSEAQRTYIFKQSGRARFCKKYTVACNTPFQGIAADGAKEAVIRVFEECLFSKQSALYGCKPLLFVHDEIVLECPFDGSEKSRREATNAADRLSKIMEEAMEAYTPDIPALAEVSLSNVWTKDAESDRQEDGTLSVYIPSASYMGTEDVPCLDSPKKALFISRIHALYETYYK